MPGSGRARRTSCQLSIRAPAGLFAYKASGPGRLSPTRPTVQAARPGPLPGPQGGPACIAAVDRGTPDYPVVYEHSPANVSGLQIQLAMSVPDELGELAYDENGDWSVRWADDSATPSAQVTVS